MSTSKSSSASANARINSNSRDPSITTTTTTSTTTTAATIASSDYVMYIVVNHSLAMGKGKIGAQVGHAVQMVIEDLLQKHNVTSEQLKLYQAWRHAGNMAKIVLKADQEQMLSLSSHKDARVVHDAGRTQIPAGSLTAIAFPPMLRNNDSQARFGSYGLL